jgi:type IV pilus assembly protein PilM
MAVLRHALGLDLGSHSLKAVEFQQGLRGVEASALRTLPRPPEDVPLAELVERFLTMHKLSTDHVVTALRGDRISSRHLNFPFSDRRRLAQAVPFAVEEDLPLDLDDVVIDWEIVGGDRSRSEVLAAIAPRSEVSTLLAQLDEAGCAPRTLEAEGLVLANLCAVFDLPGTRILADLGHARSTLCLVVDGRAIASRTFPIGGRHLTEALAADRGLSIEDAERAKCEEDLLGERLSPPPQTAKVLDRLAREIVRTVATHEQRLGGFRVDEVTIFGGTALLQRLDGFLAERTGLPTARLGLPIEGQGKSLVAGGPPILYAPAIALGLRGTSRARTAMNFRRDEFAVRIDLGQIAREFRWTGWLAGVAVALALISYGTSLFFDGRRARALEAQAASMYAEIVPGAPVPDDPVAALSSQLSSATDRADYLGVYRGNLSALDVLTELSKIIPKNLEIGLEELSIDRQTIRMKVQAQDFRATDRLQAALQKFPPFAAARIGAIETEKKTGNKRFSVTISLQEDRE